MKKLHYTLVLGILFFAVIGIFSVAGQFSSVIAGSQLWLPRLWLQLKPHQPPPPAQPKT